MSMKDLEKVKQEISKAEDRIRYYEQQGKIMRSEIQRLTRKERTHRLCTRGGLVEHFILEPDLLTCLTVRHISKWLIFQQIKVVFTGIAAVVDDFRKTVFPI